ncbi:MAG: DUF924 family protein [Pseudomonadota bacterium]
MSEQNDTPESVLDFWFADATNDPKTFEQRNDLWFNGGAKFDKEIRSRFSGLFTQAQNGELRTWKLSPEGTLALIIMFDQFPRNIFRGDERSFAYDLRAQALARDGVASGIDQELAAAYRVFFYMPFMHAEDLEAQQLSIRCFEKQLEDAALEWQPIMAKHLDFAKSHFEEIRQFGRFPHRNAVLGRTSTSAESRWLSSEDVH